MIQATGLTALTNDLLEPIQTGFPRGAVYRLLKSLQRGKTNDYWRWLERAMRDHLVLPASFGISLGDDDPPPSWTAPLLGYPPMKYKPETQASE